VESGALERTVSENVAGGANVGTLSTDNASTDLFTYTLVMGTGNDNNSLFTVNGNLLNTVGPLHLGTYSVRVQTTNQNGQG